MGEGGSCRLMDLFVCLLIHSVTNSSLLNSSFFQSFFFPLRLIKKKVLSFLSLICFFLSFFFSVILCGWLGSEQQLSNGILFSCLFFFLLPSSYFLCTQQLNARGWRWVDTGLLERDKVVVEFGLKKRKDETSITALKEIFLRSVGVNVLRGSVFSLALFLQARYLRD